MDIIPIDYLKRIFHFVVLNWTTSNYYSRDSDGKWNLNRLSHFLLQFYFGRFIYLRETHLGFQLITRKFLISSFHPDQKRLKARCKYNYGVLPGKGSEKTTKGEVRKHLIPFTEFYIAFLNRC